MSVKIVVLMDLSFFVIGSTTHLSGWNGIIHFSPHLASLSRSSCKLLLSDETVEKRKRLGPSTDPCGTPDSTYMMSDFSPSMTTRCVLSDRKPFIHAFVFPLIPYCGLGGCGLLCQMPLRSP